MILAERMHRLGTESAFEVLARAHKLAQQGRDIINLGIGQPDFPTPENIVAAAFWSAERRYDISFKEITGRVPVFHPDVQVWEVTDSGTGVHRGLFYFDSLARPGKRSGAWAMSYRGQEKLNGAISPITSNNNNFVKGAAGEPTLISLDDAETLFHEFGHALHALLLRWLPRLAADGVAWLVVAKHKGSDSLQQWLGEQGWQADRHASGSGFRVLKVTRPGPA